MTSLWRTSEFKIVRNLLLGVFIGWAWSALLFLAYVAYQYVVQSRQGTVYWDLFLLQTVPWLYGALSFPIFAVLGAVASLNWPARHRPLDEASHLPPGVHPLVITIHGTFAASSSDDGQSWWQKGGLLERSLAGYSQGPLSICPFHWSGLNSQDARRRAAARLAGILMRLERQQRRYHIVAHSHGGNVVWAALLNAASKRNRLDHLQSWTTVGTPFLRIRAAAPNWWHVVPLGVLIAAFAFPTIGVADIVSKTQAMWSIFLSFEGGLLAPIVMYILTGAMALTGVTFGARLTWGLAGIFHNYRASSREMQAASMFASRHLALFSSQDEAIHALRLSAAVDVRLVPRLPYFNRSVLGKLLSPLTLVPVAVLNGLTSSVVNERILSAIRSKILGLDQPGIDATLVSALPDGDPVSASLDRESEARLQVSTSRVAGGSLAAARSALGAYATGSSIGLSLEHFDSTSFQALVHNAYFDCDLIGDRILTHLERRETVSQQQPVPDERRRLQTRTSSSWLAGSYHAALTSVVLLLVWAAAITIQATAIAPRATHSRIDQLIDRAAILSLGTRSDISRAWFASACAIGHCVIGGFDPSVESDDHLQVSLDYIRWQAACTGADCKTRDEMLQSVRRYIHSAAVYTSPEEKRFEDPESGGNEARSRRFWMVASALGNVRQVPDVFTQSFEFRSSIPANPVTERAALDAVSKEVVNAPLQVNGPAVYRSRLVYATPLVTLHVTPADFEKWDARLSLASRLAYKIELAEASTCRLAEAYRSTDYDDSESPIETVLRLNRTPVPWWGECDQHLAVARAALEDAGRIDLSTLPTSAEQVRLLARYWATVHQVRGDVAAVERHSISTLQWQETTERRLQQAVEGAIARAVDKDWLAVRRIVEAMGGWSKSLVSPALSVEIEKRAISTVLSNADALPEMIRVCQALPSCEDLRRALVQRLSREQDLPDELEVTVVRFSDLVGPDLIDKYCQTGRTAPCNLLKRMNSAWAIKKAARAAGAQTLRAAAKEDPFGFDGERSKQRDIQSLFRIEAALRDDLLAAPGRRLGSATASRMYAEAARGLASVGKFQQALTYLDSVTSANDRLLASTDIVLRYEQLRRTLHTGDLDYVADWGNREWDAARKEWIHNNPGH